MLWCRQLEDSYTNIAESYKEFKERGWDDLIDDDMLKIVAKGGYIRDNGLKGVEKGYKPYYDYLKYGNQYQEEDNNMSLRDEILEISERLAKRYKKYKDEDKNYMIDDDMLECVSIGGFLSNGGKCGDINKGYKPYYDYLKYGNQYQEEEPIMIEDNNYETAYSFEYEPYLLQFDHEVDRNNSIQMIEEMYNEDNIEEDIDSNDIINIMDVLTNKISKVKNTIIHYISNYRPIMNQYTDTIEAVLIE